MHQFHEYMPHHETYPAAWQPDTYPAEQRSNPPDSSYAPVSDSHSVSQSAYASSVPANPARPPYSGQSQRTAPPYMTPAASDDSGEG